MISRTKFYCLLGLLGALSGLGQWRLFCHGWQILADWSFGLLFMLAPLLFVVPHTLSSRLPLWLEQILGRVGGYYFFATYYLTLLLLPCGLMKLLFLIPGLEVYEQSVLQGYARFVAFLVTSLMIAGYWRAHHPVVRHVEVLTEKSIPRDFTVAFASDIHLGPSIGAKFARRMVTRLNELQPDLVLFGGDMMDGDQRIVERQGGFQALAGIHAAWGVYGVLGNHDHYGYDVNRVKEQLQQSGIRILSGETVEPAKGVALTGIMDARYHGEAPGIPELPGIFHILIEHEPVHINEAAKAQGNLYLAGHTHAGQYWPNRIFVRKLFPFDYGTKLFDQLTAVVTSGYGSWGARFRTGPAPEIVLVEVKGEK